MTVYIDLLKPSVRATAAAVLTLMDDMPLVVIGEPVARKAFWEGDLSEWSEEAWSTEVEHAMVTYMVHNLPNGEYRLYKYVSDKRYLEAVLVRNGQPYWAMQ